LSLPTLLAGTVYTLALNHLDRMALDHRENLISQLGR
jgi:hypothetical protein